VAAAMRAELVPIRAMRLPDVTYLLTGVGLRNAERAIRGAVARSTPDAVVHCGYAGALSSDLKIGDVLVAETIRGVYSAEVNPDLLRASVAVRVEGVTLRTAVFLSFDHVYVSAREKYLLAREFAADGTACLDMESAAVARVCAESRIPYLGIRCITDAFDEDLPIDLNRCRKRDGGFGLARMGWQIACVGPGAISGLLELQRRAKRCSQNLARVVAAIHATRGASPG
jgi:nucleoside phosphorylase